MLYHKLIIFQSANGILVNGHKLEKDVLYPLHHGDTITLANYYSYTLKKESVPTTETNTNRIFDHDYTRRSNISEATVISTSASMDNNFQQSTNEHSVIDKIEVYGSKNSSIPNIGCTSGSNNMQNNYPNNEQISRSDKKLADDCANLGKNNTEKINAANEKSSTEICKMPESSTSSLFKDQVEEELVCSICTELFIKTITLGCSHSFCDYCLKHWIKSKMLCPICRKNITSQTPTLAMDNIIQKVRCT